MEALLVRRERLGLTWAELARRSGHPVWKLRWWHDRLKKPPRPRKSARPFVAVQITGPARPIPAPLEITTPSGFCVLVPPDFDADHVRRLLQVLEPGC